MQNLTATRPPSCDKGGTLVDGEAEEEEEEEGIVGESSLS